MKKTATSRALTVAMPMATTISAGPRLSFDAVTVITVKKINAANTPNSRLNGITCGCAP